MKTNFRKMCIFVSALVFLAMAFSMVIPIQTVRAVALPRVDIYNGRSVTTPASVAYGGGSGDVYGDATPFNLANGDLTLYALNVDMKNNRTLNWTCSPYAPPLPAPTFNSVFAFGVTIRSSVGNPNPHSSAWTNLTMAGAGSAYYLGQQSYKTTPGWDRS